MANTSEDSLNAHNSNPTVNPTYINKSFITMYIYTRNLQFLNF